MESKHLATKDSGKTQDEINQDLKQENQEIRELLINLIKDFEATQKFIDRSNSVYSSNEIWLEKSKVFFGNLLNYSKNLEASHRAKMKELKRACQLKTKEIRLLVNEIKAKKPLDDKK